MVPNGTNALRSPTRDVDSKDDYDDDNSSYEDESLSDEEESYISYYSEDQLTVILEETDQDLLEEMSMRGSTSCRSRHECYKFVDDLPPSPPVRRWTDEMELKNNNNNNVESITNSPQSWSCRTSTTSNVTLSSQSTATTDNRFLPPFTYSGDSRISNESEIRSWDGDNYDYDEDDNSCCSGPLNDLPTTRRGEPKFGTRQNGGMNESLQGSSYMSLSLQGSSFLSFQNGDGVYAVSQSDDEYTFVSCTTGDDMSLISDIGSSRHARSIACMDDIERDHTSIPQSTTDQQLSTHNDSGVVGSSSHRRMSGLSIDADLLSPIPEGDNSDDENPSISHQPLNYQLVQKRLNSQIQSSLAKISESETLLLDESNTASAHRLIAIKRRLQLERYGGVRRRRTFERAKNVLGKKLKYPTERLHQCYEPQTHHDQDCGDEIVSPLDDNLARFGGLTRRESFYRNKSTFEKKFDKEVKPHTSPLHRRHSLSPVRRHASFDKPDFHRRMSKSDSQLIVDMHEGIDQLNDHEEKGMGCHENSEFEESLKMRQERFGGLGRRKSFNRSRRFLKKKFERLQARSEEDKERFGGLQRMASYKQSRKLFENYVQGSRGSRSLLNSSERVTNISRRF